MGQKQQGLIQAWNMEKMFSQDLLGAVFQNLLEHCMCLLKHSLNNNCIDPAMCMACRDDIMILWHVEMIFHTDHVQDLCL